MVPNFIDPRSESPWPIRLTGGFEMLATTPRYHADFGMVYGRTYSLLGAMIAFSMIIILYLTVLFAFGDLH